MHGRGWEEAAAPSVAAKHVVGCGWLRPVCVVEQRLSLLVVCALCAVYISCSPCALLAHWEVVHSRHNKLLISQQVAALAGCLLLQQDLQHPCGSASESGRSATRCVGFVGALGPFVSWASLIFLFFLSLEGLAPQNY